MKRVNKTEDTFQAQWKLTEYSTDGSLSEASFSEHTTRERNLLQGHSWARQTTSYKHSEKHVHIVAPSMYQHDIKDSKWQKNHLGDSLSTSEQNLSNRTESREYIKRFEYNAYGDIESQFLPGNIIPLRDLADGTWLWNKAQKNYIDSRRRKRFWKLRKKEGKMSSVQKVMQIYICNNLLNELSTI